MSVIRTAVYHRETYRYCVSFIVIEDYFYDLDEKHLTEEVKILVRIDPVNITIKNLLMTNTVPI